MIQGQANAQFDKDAKVGGSSRRRRKTKSKKRVKSY
jgi:hypothetical protein